MRDRALVIYSRPPHGESIKTRLSTVFSPEERLALHEAMLIDTITSARREAADLASIFLSWSGEAEPNGPLRDAIGDTPVEYQMGDDLGERMSTTFQNKLGEGFGKVVIMGSDAPGLPVDHLHQAFEVLTAVDAVIGPAHDGGYYLIGCRRILPKLFQNIPWGSDRVLSVTRGRIRDGRLLHHELPPWHDVDTPTDVRRLWKHLERMRAKGIDDFPHRTWETLARLVPGRL